jgi:putative GTP pyrophosphokinase
MTPVSRNPEQWGEAYREERPRYEAFTRALEGLLGQLLEVESIPYVQIEGRTKEVPNLVAKLHRKNGKYDALSEVTDLVGLRVVLFYLDDVERVGELIGQEFAVDPKHSEDKSAALDPDRFGYLSVHHVVKLSASRKQSREWKRYGEIWAEIQVRTVLQHAWGAINRKLAYASIREAPRELQRNLNRLSALLELADDEFVDIRLARERIEAAYSHEVEHGNLDLEIDESSLESYLNETGARDRIERLAVDSGVPPKYFTEGEDFERIRRDVSRRLQEAIEAVGLKRISELDELLSELWASAPGLMRAVTKGFTDDDDQPVLARNPDNWLTLLLLWGTEAPAEVFERIGYASRLVGTIVATHRGD